MKNWHAFWHVGMPIPNTDTSYGTLARLFARWYAKMTGWHTGTWQVKHIGTQACWHVKHAGTQAQRHLDHVETQARMAHDLANP